MEEIIVRRPLENLYCALNYCFQLPEGTWYVRLPQKVSKPKNGIKTNPCTTDEVLELMHNMRMALNDGAELSQIATFIFAFDNEDSVLDFRRKHGK